MHLLQALSHMTDGDVPKPGRGGRKGERGGGAAQQALDPRKDWIRSTFDKLGKVVEAEGWTWTEAFRKFSKTGRDGEMRREDFHAAMRRADSNLSSFQMDELMLLLDTNGDGDISLNEWLYRFDTTDSSRPPGWEDEAFQRVKDAMQRKKMSLADLLRRIDANGDGSLSCKELANGLMGLDPSLSRHMALDLARATDTTDRGMVDNTALHARLTDDTDGTLADAAAGKEDRLMKRIRSKLLKVHSPESIALLFQRFDLDGDGTVSRSEFKRGLRSMGVGLTTSEIETLMRSSYKKGASELDFNDFVTQFLKRETVPQDEIKHIKRQVQLAVFDQDLTWKQLFSRWDTAQSSCLSVKEFKAGMLALPGLMQCESKMLEGTFQAADKDEDGLLSFFEFQKFFTQGLSKHLDGNRAATRTATSGAPPEASLGASGGEKRKRRGEK